MKIADVTVPPIKEHRMKSCGDNGEAFLHWTCPWSEEETNTYWDLEGLQEDYYHAVKAKSGKERFRDVARWVDQEALNRGVPVLIVLEEIVQKYVNQGGLTAIT